MILGKLIWMGLMMVVDDEISQYGDSLRSFVIFNLQWRLDDDSEEDVGIDDFKKNFSLQRSSYSFFSYDLKLISSDMFSFQM